MYVRRYQAGECVHVFNGDGLLARANIAKVHKNQCVVNVETIEQFEKSARKVMLACALPKQERMQVLLDLSTQCGVTDVIPVKFDRSVTVLTPRKAISKISKWKKCLIESCKQSGRLFLPTIHESVSLNELLSRYSKQESMDIWYGDIHGANLMSDKHRGGLGKSVMIIIGPEGGFTDSEFNMMDGFGIHGLRLSSNILRIEAAAISAVALLDNVYG